MLASDMASACGSVGDAFAARLINWQRQHGRHDLPWQGTRDPYRVWLSEVMLQQTQVSTVKAYYARFLERFPSLHDLADASEDDVLALWSGLGYYSRARNLHRCAQMVRDRYGGEFPTSRAALEHLPGIGASTAAAIAAFCFGERVSIFDANVQRVMARLFACGADLSRSANRRALLQAADSLLPAARPATTLNARIVSYTQGLMDLGATICLPHQPACERCPVAVCCRARAQGRASDYPAKPERPKRTVESWWLLALIHASADTLPRLWLQKRPSQGIWGGLHCVPVFADEAGLQRVLVPWAGTAEHVMHAPIRHVLTHKVLLLHPVSVRVADPAAFPKGVDGGWQEDWHTMGLPAPVRKWLNGLAPLSSLPDVSTGGAG